MNYYFVSVWCFGTPMYLRDLTLDEATQLYEHNKAQAGVCYCQYGVVGAIKPLGSTLEEFHNAKS